VTWKQATSTNFAVAFEMAETKGENSRDHLHHWRWRNDGGVITGLVSKIWNPDLWILVEQLFNEFK